MNWDPVQCDKETGGWHRRLDLDIMHAFFWTLTPIWRLVMRLVPKKDEPAYKHPPHL